MPGYIGTPLRARPFLFVLGKIRESGEVFWKLVERQTRMAEITSRGYAAEL
jgi:hypothetical protein